MFWCRMMRKFTLYFSAIFMLFCSIASAQSTRTVEESQLISKAEAAFSSLSSLRAEFIQISADGAISQGMIYLRRPYQLRLDYINPDSLSLITSKRVIYIDDKMRHLGSKKEIVNRLFNEIESLKKFQHIDTSVIRRTIKMYLDFLMGK